MQNSPRQTIFPAKPEWQQPAESTQTNNIPVQIPHTHISSPSPTKEILKHPHQDIYILVITLLFSKIRKQMSNSNKKKWEYFGNRSARPSHGNAPLFPSFFLIPHSPVCLSSFNLYGCWSLHSIIPLVSCPYSFFGTPQ